MNEFFASPYISLGNILFIQDIKMSFLVILPMKCANNLNLPNIQTAAYLIIIACFVRVDYEII